MDDMAWTCGPCGCNVKDEADTGTQCPRCKAPRKMGGASDVEKKPVLPKLKVYTEGTLQRAALPPDANGALQLPQQTKEAVTQATKLQDEISRLEGMSGAEEVLAGKRKELSTLKTKLPQSGQLLQDHADVVNALKELEEKASKRKESSRKNWRSTSRSRRRS